jgi:hypothetical protein
MRLVLAVRTLDFLLQSGGWLSSSPPFSMICHAASGATRRFLAESIPSNRA